MRDIIFRGKGSNSDKWCYGFLVPYPGSICGWALVKECYLDKGRSSINAFGYTEVMNNTVGQYTGMNDKNGNRIFEGDILRMDTFNPDICEVRFIEGAFCLQFPGGLYPIDIHYIHHADRPQAMVIGNIHDNPELLEVGS